MPNKPTLTRLGLLVGLLALTFGGYALARLLPDVGAGASPDLPPLSRLRLPPQSANGITVTLDSYYADALRLVFKIRFERQTEAYALENFSLTNSRGEEINSGYSNILPGDDPSVILLEAIPAYALTDDRLDGLSFSVISSDGSEVARLHFDLDLPILPARVAVFNNNPSARIISVANEADYLHPIYVERAVVSPSFTWFYLCYTKPTKADWMIGGDAALTVNRQTASMTTYNLLYDSSTGGGTKGGEPGWTPVGNYPRCVKIGFPIGSEIQSATELRLSIPTLEQSMPEVVPQTDLDAAYPKLRAQGIDMEWRFLEGGAYPEWKSLPAGMSEQEAMQKFMEALGYTFSGPWIFDIRLEPRDNSQPVFSTSHYGAATPIPLPVPEDASQIVKLSGWIRAFDLSPDGKFIAIATSQGIVVYDLSDRKMSILNEGENFFSVDWSPDGRKLAAGGVIMETSESGRQHLAVWDTSTWEVVFEPQTSMGSYSFFGAIAWSPDGKYLAAGLADQGLAVFDVDAENVIAQRSDFLLPPNKVSWSPDGSRLVATGDLGFGIRRWWVKPDQAIRLYDQRSDAALGLAWSPDGQRIASTHQNGTVCFWTAATNQCDGLIYAHNSWAEGLAWSPDGSRLATGGGIIRVWDSQTGKLVISFGEKPALRYVQLAWPTPRTLVSLERNFGGEEEKTVIRFWDLDMGGITLQFEGGPFEK